MRKSWWLVGIAVLGSLVLAGCGATVSTSLKPLGPSTNTTGPSTNTTGPSTKTSTPTVAKGSLPPLPKDITSDNAFAMKFLPSVSTKAPASFGGDIFYNLRDLTHWPMIGQVARFGLWYQALYVHSPHAAWNKYPNPSLSNYLANGQSFYFDHGDLTLNELTPPMSQPAYPYNVFVFGETSSLFTKNGQPRKGGQLSLNLVALTFHRNHTVTLQFNPSLNASERAALTPPTLRW